MTKKERAQSPNQAAPQRKTTAAIVPQSQWANYLDRLARTWTVADERGACKVMLAFTRFRREVNTDAAAALLVQAWMQTIGDTGAEDRKPYVE